MAEVNLKPGSYTSIIFKPPAKAVADMTTPQTILSTGAGQAAYVSGLWATNLDPGTWDVTVYVYKGAAILFYVCQAEPIKANGKPGNNINLLRGVPLFIPESCDLKCHSYTTGYHGASGTGTNYALVNASWALIT